MISNGLAAMGCGIINALIGKKRAKYKKVKPEDFLIYRAPKKPKTQKQLLGLVEILNEAFGGKDLRANPDSR